jgi:sugar lactone lactonase YvrE
MSASSFTITPSPMGISIDNNGNLYFVDVKENLIISFDKEGKERFALDRFGTAEGQFIDPFGITTSSNTFYISDQKLGRILAFDTNGEYKFSIYSKTYQPYSVAEPSGVSEDSDGNLLICDQLTGRILKVNDDFSIKDLDFSESEIPFKDVKSHGEVGQLSFIFYPQKIQLDADGNIYVLDYGSLVAELCESGLCIGSFARILKFSPDLKYEKTIADVENFPFLNDFIIWKEHIFATALFKGVFKFDLDGKIIAQNTSLGMPEEIAKGEDGNLYIADSSNSLINVLDTNLKEIKKIGAFGNTEGKLAHPEGVAVSENGDIYVADTKNSRIVVFDKNGNYNFLFGSFGNENNEFVNPTRVFVSGENVLVADPYASTVKVFDLSGNFKRYIASSKFFSGAFVSPTKVATNSSGMFAVLDGYMGRVILYKDGMYFESFNIFSDYSKRFSNFIKENELVIGDIALGEDGSVYVLNGNSSTVTRFYKNGQSADVDSSLISLKPTAIAISNDDTFYAASASKEKVIYGKWVSGSLVREGEIDLSKLHPSSKNPIYPSSIFVKDNILYITDTLNFSVIVFNMITKHLITIPINYPESEMSNTPEGVVADNSGNIYVCNSAFSRIEVYDNKGNFLYTFGKRGGPLGNASVLNDFPGAVRGYVGYFLYPSGIALSNNQLYIVDMLNRRIQMFDIGSIPLKTGTPCLAASTSKQGVILNWKDINENEARGYTIFKEKDNSFEEIAEVTLDKNFYIDRDVKNGSTYSYFVRTIVNEGGLSFPTNIVSVNAEGVIKDITSPEITVSSPLNYSTVETNSIVLKGKATDESSIDKVTVNGSEVSVSSNGSFSKTVNLTEGTNTITVIATDIVGNTTTKTITVTYQKQTVFLSERLPKHLVQKLHGLLQLKVLTLHSVNVQLSFRLVIPLP